MDNFKFNPSSNVYSDMDKYEKEHWWYKGLRDLLLYEVKKLKVTRILDAGCGTGNNIEFFNFNGFNASGFDISNESIKICNSKGLKKVKIGNLLDIPFPDESFDLITCLDIYGNLDKKESKIATKEIYRVCNSSGYVLINTSALPWMYSLHDKAWDIKQRYYLVDLIKLLEDSNFKVLKATYRVSLLFPLIFIIRFIEKMFPSKEIRGDTHKTNFVLNFAFYQIMKVENFLLKFTNLPIGNSVFLIAQKK